MHIFKEKIMFFEALSNGIHRHTVKNDRLVEFCKKKRKKSETISNLMASIEHHSTGTVLKSVLKSSQQGPPCIIDQCLAPEMHRSQRTRVRLQTPRCILKKKKRKEGGNWSVVIIPSCCPSTFLHFSHFSLYSYRLCMSSLRFTRGPRVSLPAHSWRWTGDEEIRGNHWLLGREA